MTPTRKRNPRSGSTILEFALFALVTVPATLGVVGVGMTLGAYIRILQTTRDAAHMFARGIDFNTTGNQDMVVRLASTLNLTRNGGDGVVIFSKIITPYQADCDAASVQNCSNLGVPVVIHRTTVGASQLRASSYATPRTQILSGEGNIAPSDYLTDFSVRAPSATGEFTTSGVTQERGDIAYVVEGYFSLPTLRFLGYAPNGAYCRFMF